MGRPTPPIGRNADARTRLLNSLGLFQEQQQRDEAKRNARSSAAPSAEGRDSNPSDNDRVTSGTKKKIRHVRSLSDIPVRSALHNTVAFKTKLNDENATASRKEKLKSSHRRSSFSDKEKANSTASVRFNTVVSGVKIPSRNQYSRRIKQTLWRDRYELSEMVERNTTEFHAENYDWNQVVLDEEMYIDARSGERVHPCHVEGIHYDEESDEEDYDDSFGEGPGFAPLARSDSIAGDKSS
mmetsp:Transcript_3185/g.7264  ORF Transcript_3185/g.7264 Transcript_3185/m.7264 type:complete len:240 (-) Transcript_3185:545-1264(-)